MMSRAFKFFNKAAHGTILSSKLSQVNSIPFKTNVKNTLDACIMKEKGKDHTKMYSLTGQALCYL